MGAKQPRVSGKAGYPYAAVETALADVFDVDPAAQRGWLRGRDPASCNCRLRLTPEGPGKGKTIAYSGEDVDKWLLALELAHFEIDPVMAVASIKKGGTGAQRRFAKSLRRRERASARQTTSSSSSLSPPCRKSRPWAACGFGRFSAFSDWLNDPEARRASVFNLSARLRALDRALGAPSRPPGWPRAQGDSPA